LSSDDSLNSKSFSNVFSIGRPLSNDDEIIADTNTIRSLSDEDKKNFPLVVDNLEKIYITDDGRKKRALYNFSLLLKNNEIFGLLG